MAAAAQAHNSLLALCHGVGDIVVLDSIGRGSFGIVHKAQVSGHICAVKILHSDQMDAKVRARFVLDLFLSLLVMFNVVIYIKGLNKSAL